MSSDKAYDNNDLTEVKQLSMIASIASLGAIFWLVGGMEIVERIAYYGVKASATLYAKAPVSEGGLGITMADFGIILSSWALLQTFIPIFSGGVTDRIGYKETIAIATMINIAGYLTMANFPTFWGFLVGAILLASGTGFFKPGIQGTMVRATNRQNSTMAWGIFYQLVNIGGWLGPLMAAYLRQMAWENLFYACAIIISFNFLFLLIYKEPGKEERVALKKRIKAGEIKQNAIWQDAWNELKKPIVYLYMIVFSGFWFLFNALFDILPAYIDDWVDTSTIITDVFGPGGTQNSFFIGLLGMNKEGTMIMPEAMIGFNFALIMTTCFLVAAASAKYRITSSMFVGAIASCAAILMVGISNAAWIIFIAIIVFSIGEMLISPKKGELMGNIAPKDKKAMYLGFVMLPQGIGWTLEGYIAPWLYGRYASKELFSRQMLAEQGMDTMDIQAIPQGEAFQVLIGFTGQSKQALTEALLQTHNIGFSWYIITAVGTISAIGIFMYGRWLLQLQKRYSNVNHS